MLVETYFDMHLLRSGTRPMAASDTWKTVFTTWPASIPRRGLLMSVLNETIPFKSFMIKDDLLLLERSNVDSQGARFIVISFDAINSLRFVDPLKESVFTTAGFVGKLAQA